MEKIKFEDNLLDAIKKDDLKSFSLLMPTNADLNLCYGRFPILSLLYLYSSFKILSKFEKVLMPIHNFKFVDERVELYKAFKAKAKRTIRFFSGEEIIYPALMLAVLNEREILKHNFKMLYKSVEICEKLSKIYKINYNLDIETQTDSIKISSEKTSFKYNVLFVVISFICCVIVALSGIGVIFVKNNNGLGLVSSPIKISNGEEFFDALDEGDRCYSFQNDLEIDASVFLSKDFSGKIFGNGKTISIVGEINSPIIKNLSGTIENLNIKLSGNKINITQNFAVLAENSSGKIEKCVISGDFIGEYNSTEEIFAGMLVADNTGVIKASEVKVSGSFVNKNESNAYFGNIAGKNSGTIESCNAGAGIIVADTVDLAGIVCENRGVILNSENKTTMTQSSSKQWHPNIAGISIANYGKIENSKNHAELNASSTIDEESENVYYIFVGGISCENFGEITSCKNYGKVIADGKMSNIVVGGLVSQNIDNDEGLSGIVNKSLSKCDIDAKSETGSVCVGGVVGLNATSVTTSGFIGTIDADSNASTDKDVFSSTLDKEVVVYAGGVVGLSQYSEIKNCYADSTFLANGNVIVPSEEDEPQKIYAGIVGNVGIYAYYESLVINPFYPDRQYKTNAMTTMENNYFVGKTEAIEKVYGVFATTANWEYVSGVLVAITDDILNSYFGGSHNAFYKVASLQEIPLEVVYE